jgi:hypothetical protein
MNIKIQMFPKYKNLNQIITIKPFSSACFISKITKMRFLDRSLLIPIVRMWLPYPEGLMFVSLGYTDDSVGWNPMEVGNTM